MPRINAGLNTLRTLFAGGLNSNIFYIEGYTNTHGEKSRLVVDISVDYMDVVRASLEKLENIDPADIVVKTGIELGVCVNALNKVRASLENTIQNGAGNNENYTHSAENREDGVPTYESVVHGIKLHTESGNLHVQGLLVSKQIITPGEYPVVNSRALTIAQNAIKKELPISNWRQYKLAEDGNFEAIMSNGKTILKEEFFA